MLILLLFSTVYLVVLVVLLLQKKNVVYQVTLKPRLSHGKVDWKDLTGRRHYSFLDRV